MPPMIQTVIDLQQAVSAAPANSSLQLQPGTYRLSLCIDKNLQLDGEDVILVATDGPALLVQNATVTLTGITVQGAYKHPAFIVQEGRLEATHCHFRGENHGVGLISGSSTLLKLSHCTVFDGMSTGLHLHKNTKAELDNCILGYTHDDVIVCEGAHLVIRHSKVLHGGQAGIWLHSQSQGVIENCLLTNHHNGNLVSENSTVELTHCRLHNGGLSLRDKTIAKAQEIEILGSEMAIYMVNQSRLTLRNAWLHDESYGIGLFYESHLTAERCILSHFSKSAVWAKDESSVNMQQCIAHQCKEFFFAEADGPGAVHEVVIWDCEGDVTYYPSRPPKSKVEELIFHNDDPQSEESPAFQNWLESQYLSPTTLRFFTEQALPLADFEQPGLFSQITDERQRRALDQELQKWLQEGDDFNPCQAAELPRLQELLQAGEIDKALHSWPSWEQGELYAHYLQGCTIDDLGILHFGPALADLDIDMDKAYYLLLSLITQAPEDIPISASLKRQNILALSLHQVELSRLPESIGNLTELRSLSLRHNALTRIPQQLGNLSSLLHLDLSHNQLREVPSQLGSLPKLCSLELQYNQLAELPSSLGFLHHLKSLNCSNNQLRDLPFTLASLQQLTALYADDNQFSVLPSCLQHWKSVYSLSFNCNQITHIPADMAHLPALESLYLRANPIESPQQALDMMGNKLWLSS